MRVVNHDTYVTYDPYGSDRDAGHYGTFSQLTHGEPKKMTIHRGVTVKIVHLHRRKA